jgi:hypothetical protein
MKIDENRSRCQLGGGRFVDAGQAGIDICVRRRRIGRVVPARRAEESSMDDSSQPHDPRDDEQPYLRWAPLYVPLFAAVLVVLMMLIEAGMV